MLNGGVVWTAVLFAALGLFVGNALLRRRRSLARDAAAGFVLWQAVDNWFDFALYPVALGWLGLKDGFALMFVVSLLWNAAYISINNATEVDWTLMDRFMRVPAIRRVAQSTLLGMPLGRIAIFGLLTLKFDSFWAVNFLYGKGASLMRPAVVMAFLISHTITNIVWTLGWGAVLVPLRIVMRALGTGG